MASKQSEELNNKYKKMILEQMEKEGFVSQLKAQIKDRVYKTIDSQSKTVKQNLEFDYLTPFQRQNKSKEVMLAVHLIRDFLKFYEMEYTLPVFQNETNVHENIAKETLVNDLELNNKGEEDNRPLLVTAIASLLEQNEKLKNLKQAEKPNVPSSPVDEFDYSLERGGRDNAMAGLDVAKAKKKLSPIMPGNMDAVDEKSPKMADKFNQSLTASLSEPKKEEEEEEVDEEIIADDDTEKENKQGTSAGLGSSQTLGYDNSVTSYHLDFNDYVEDIEPVE